MPKSPRPYRQSPTGEWMLMLMLSLLVAGVIVSGLLHYTLLLAVLSAIFVGFFGWLWWSRTQAEAAAGTRARRTGARAKPGKRRAPAARKRRR